MRLKLLAQAEARLSRLGTASETVRAFSESIPMGMPRASRWPFLIGKAAPVWSHHRVRLVHVQRLNPRLEQVEGGRSNI